MLLFGTSTNHILMAYSKGIDKQARGKSSPLKS